MLTFFCQIFDSPQVSLEVLEGVPGVGILVVVLERVHLSFELYSEFCELIDY